MATINEIIASGSGKLTNKTAEFEKKYAITGTSSDGVVRALVLGASPSRYNGLPRSNVTFAPTAHNVFEATVTYSQKENEQEQPQFSFNTAGATTHISHSIETVDTHEVHQGQGAPNFKNGINVTKDEVKGVDVVIPTLTFSETHKFDPTFVTTKFIKSLMENTGKTNTKKFREFEPGEVLFTGCDGAYSEKRVAINYNFTVSKNLKNLEVAGVTPIEKKGHDYVWVFYQDGEDDYTGEIIKGPRAIYVERIYEAFDFKELGLPIFPPAKRNNNQNNNGP